MPVYYVKKYEATHTATFAHEHRCKKCGKTSYANVQARGYAQAHSPFGLDGSASHRASDDAWAASAKNARSTLRFATCPKCGFKNRAGLLLFLLKVFVLLGLASGLFFVFAGYFWTSREKFMGLLFGACGIAMMIGLYWAYFHPKWANADRRVDFNEDDQDEG
jgi:hypothetical protein